METKPLDFVLVLSSITLLLCLAGLTSALLSPDNSYRLVLEILVFLLSYALYSALFLKITRHFKAYPEGRFTMDSFEFTYWKLCAVVVDLASKAFNLFNTVVTQPLIYSAFGAHIGKNTAIAGTLRDHPLLYIDDFATIGQNSVITGHVIVHNEIILKPVKIGRNAVVGINSVVMPGVILEEGAVLAPGSVATMDTLIPSYEFWGGIPAHKLKDIPRD
jgi:hypothetical protein